MTIAESLRRFRKDFRLTQKEVADVLEVTPQAYQVYEVKVKPSAEVIVKIADAFNVSTDYLLGRCDNPNGLKSVDIDSEFVQSALAFNNALQALIEKHKGGET
ncbi:MAG: helix-turn-helix transcriptional regulator [Selenomonadaceae bacterium]|nr:helix-turn-helix transcriptional regulator [Selenomonadaceae bacterium]